MKLNLHDQAKFSYPPPDTKPKKNLRGFNENPAYPNDYAYQPEPLGQILRDL